MKKLFPLSALFAFLAIGGPVITSMGGCTGAPGHTTPDDGAPGDHSVFGRDSTGHTTPDDGVPSDTTDGTGDDDLRGSTGHTTPNDGAPSDTTDDDSL